MSTKKKKQGSLFSFFAKTSSPSPAAKAPKKPPRSPSTKSGGGGSPSVSSKSPSAASPPAVGANPPSKGGRSSSPAVSARQAALLAKITVGTRVAVYWPDDKEYYPAVLQSWKRGTDHVYTLLYDDGEVETVGMAGEKFRIIGGKRRSNDDDDDGDGAPGPGKDGGGGEGKKRRILEDTEDEFDPDMDDISAEESEGSAFVAGDEDDDADDDDDALMVTDDDDDEPLINYKKKSGSGAKGLKVTRVDKGKASVTPPGGGVVLNACSDDSNHAADEKTPNLSGGGKDGGGGGGSSEAFFATFASGMSTSARESLTPKSSVRGKKITPSPKPTPAEPPNPAQPPASSSGSAGSEKDWTRPPKPEAKGVSPAGTHWHNHFHFLRRPRDAKGRKPADPDYDPRTLMVDYNEIQKVTGSKVSDAQRQWWELKKIYADVMLLFKVGKFYEIFHQDSDEAVRILGLMYMSGPSAHCGFPEGAYGYMTDKLVRAGCKVARVEQTETPDALNKRKKGAPKGKKPQVVNREVCSIMTAGTRTFCYLDNTACVDKGESSGVGPLLAIKEIPLNRDDVMEEDGNGNARPMCEFGIAVVDAVLGTVTLGQFEDDVLMSRMGTLLAKFEPSEILIEGGQSGASEMLLSLLKTAAAASTVPPRVERIKPTETFPKSTALDADVRRKMERPTPIVQPWDVDETLQELHRRGYYPRSSRSTGGNVREGVGRWPEVLKACVQGGADPALSAFGAALFYLQRSLIDEEILSMGVVKPYVPPQEEDATTRGSTSALKRLSAEEGRKENGIDQHSTSQVRKSDPLPMQDIDTAAEAQITHMTLDGTTLANLEILANSHSNTVSGSLWSKINHTKSPHGSRLLRAWLLRPLFQKPEIDRRADAVEELVSGGAAVAMAEARTALSRCGDIQRLLSRVHSMGVGAGAQGHHPNDRAVLYETATYTKRKVGDFSKLLQGLRSASRIPDLFAGIDIRSSLLSKIVRTHDEGGYFPSDLNERLDWFFDNFDCDKAAKGDFEPARGMDEAYDQACNTIERIEQDLGAYKEEMCAQVLQPSRLAKESWKYANTGEDAKDKYLIELPVSVRVPANFEIKGKRGKGPKQINKYRTPVVAELVRELEEAIDMRKSGKAKGMQLVFARFDSMRPLWENAAMATASLDALGALAETASQPGFSRPIIAECGPEAQPQVRVLQGRHPCVEVTHSGEEFIPNDLALGGEGEDGAASRVLLLSGPNMGGKSTLLRQTCLIAILAQIGCFVPAEECTVSPIDRIFTRLGASDRLLLGQSTFFVELAETAAALRGATRRSLVIMDELGRGTSTFDGTAIASATVKHLVEKNRCLALFATHYHSLLEDWKEEPIVRLGHMECIVEDGSDDDGNTEKDGEPKDCKITFLYTLGEGSCPKSFGINVARLAGLPEEVLSKAKLVSANFEAEMNGAKTHIVSPSSAPMLKQQFDEAMRNEDLDEAERLWQKLQS